MTPKPRLEWSHPALSDLEQIVTDIAEVNPQAAQDLKDEIEAKVAALVEYPKLYAKSRRAPGYRQLTVGANYLVFYRLLSENAPQEVIDVAAVIHARRQWPLSALQGCIDSPT